MSNFTAIREALLAALPDDLTAEVITGDQKAPQTFGGKLSPPLMLVRAYVGNPSDPEAQKRLDHLLDASQDDSVADYLYRGDQTLGELVKGIQIVSATGWRTYPTKDGQVLGAEWTVQTH
jgi:hypothetical protein